MPEFWTGGMIPHPGLSTVGFWFYQALGGIAPDPEHPGFKVFVIRPQLAPGVTWAEAEYRSVLGLISCRWQRDGYRLIVSVKVPANTEAVINVPGAEARRLPATGEPTVQAARLTTGEAAFRVPGGQYTFEAVAGSAQ